MTAPGRSARIPSSARNTRPPAPDFFHSVSKLTASRPSGDDEDRPDAFSATPLFAPADCRGFTEIPARNEGLQGRWWRAKRLDLSKPRLPQKFLEFAFRQEAKH